MEILYCVVVFLFGLIIGSFLNVVIYRMHTGKSLNGRSHCMSCGETLAWFELLPLFSYLALRARCRYCSSYIPPRYFIVEIATALLFLVLWHVFQGEYMLLVFYAILSSVLMLVAVYDMRHTIIPDELSILLAVLAAVYIAALAVLVKDFFVVLPALASGFGAAAFFGGLWYISKGRWMGLGDAKLAFPLGMIAGFPGAYSMVVFSFFIGAAISLLIILLQYILKKGKTILRYSPTTLTIKSEVPFAPFLILGFMAVALFHADIFEITFLLF